MLMVGSTTPLQLHLAGLLPPVAGQLLKACRWYQPTDGGPSNFVHSPWESMAHSEEGREVKKLPPEHPAGFKFYPNDWLSSPKVSIMTPAEEGAYIRLLAYCWADKQFSLPDDDTILARLSRLGELWLKGSSTVVRACFIPHPILPNRIVNARLLKERCKQTNWIAKCRKAGINSGKSRRKQSELKMKGSSTTLEAARSLGLSLSLSSLNSPSSLNSLSPTNFLIKSDEIVELWNGCGLSECKKLTVPLKKKLDMMIKHHPDKDWWVALFDRVQQSDFLAGRAKDFSATLDWILGPKNFAKLEQGNYDNRQTASPTQKLLGDFVQRGEE